MIHGYHIWFLPSPINLYIAEFIDCRQTVRVFRIHMPQQMPISNNTINMRYFFPVIWCIQNIQNSAQCFKCVEEAGKYCWTLNWFLKWLQLHALFDKETQTLGLHHCENVDEMCWFYRLTLHLLKWTRAVPCGFGCMLKNTTSYLTVFTWFQPAISCWLPGPKLKPLVRIQFCFKLNYLAQIIKTTDWSINMAIKKSSLDWQ